MSRTLIVARTEFLALVRTKAFIIGVLLAPVMFGISIGIQVMATVRGDVLGRSVAVIDRTGRLYAAVALAADRRNVRLETAGSNPGPRFVVSRVDPAGRDLGAIKMELSERVRKKELFAFIDIPPAVLDPHPGNGEQVRYYSNTPSYLTLRTWLVEVLDREIAAARSSAAGLDPGLVVDLTRKTNIATLGLLERQTDGTVKEAERVGALEALALPAGLMYLMVLALMTATPHLLTAVVEEKLGRISEVLVSSISPFQLMAGKLLGSGAVSVLLALVYLGAGVYAALMTNQWDLVRPALIAWFVVFLICAIAIFGSVFIAIGAACSDIKDSQSMMQPAITLLLLPIVASLFLLRAPDSSLTVIASLVPTATPFLMLLRLAMTPAPPLWQVLLSVALTSATAVLFVWAAARIFRVGLLMQGKAPNLPELLRWIRQ